MHAVALRHIIPVHTPYQGPATTQRCCTVCAYHTTPHHTFTSLPHLSETCWCVPSLPGAAPRWRRTACCPCTPGASHISGSRSHQSARRCSHLRLRSTRHHPMRHHITQKYTRCPHSATSYHTPQYRATQHRVTPATTHRCIATLCTSHMPHTHHTLHLNIRRDFTHTRHSPPDFNSAFSCSGDSGIPNLCSSFLLSTCFDTVGLPFPPPLPLPHFPSLNNTHICW